MPSSTTFAVPCCDGEPYSAVLLSSLLAQTRDGFEILLVGDASEDGSIALARRVAGDRIRIIENPNRLGIAANWNRCVEAIETPFFCLAHQDDVYQSDYLERMLAALSASLPRRLWAFRRELSIRDGLGQEFRAPARWVRASRNQQQFDALPAPQRQPEFG